MKDNGKQVPSDFLFDLQQLDVEYQLAVGRYAGHGFAAIGQVSRDGKPALASDRHAHDANIPSFDHFAAASRKAERLSFLVG